MLLLSRKEDRNIEKSEYSSFYNYLACDEAFQIKNVDSQFVIKFHDANGKEVIVDDGSSFLIEDMNCINKFCIDFQDEIAKLNNNEVMKWYENENRIVDGAINERKKFCNLNIFYFQKLKSEKIKTDSSYKFNFVVIKKMKEKKEVEKYITLLNNFLKKDINEVEFNKNFKFFLNELSEDSNNKDICKNDEKNCYYSHFKDNIR